MCVAARCLFVVSDTFIIKGRGIILIPGIKPQGDERFRVGDIVELRKPNGIATHAKIAGIEMFTPPPADGSFPILLKESSVEIADVPIGTEVWSLGQNV